METNITPFVKFIIKFFPAFIVCFIISFIYSDPRISSFDIRSSVLQFIIDGALGAVFFAMLETLSLRLALGIFVLISLFSQPYISLQTDLSLYIRMIMFHAAIGASIYIYWQYPIDKKRFWSKSLQLAGYMGIAYLIASNIWRYIYMSNSGVFTGLLARGFILGLGLGIGIEAGNFIVNRFSADEENNETGSNEE